MKPRHPIYVISKGRSDFALTARFLLKDKVPFKLVVEPQEFDAYAANYGEGNVVTLPFSNLGQGSTPARNWCWEDAKEKGYGSHWILDDNIGQVRRLYQGKRIPCSSGPAFRAVEDFCDRYENVAIGGLNYQMFVTPTSPPFRRNVHVYSGLLIRNDVPFRWRLRYNEDTDLCLQVLTSGLSTVLVSLFMIDKKATMTMKGGNTDDLYGGDGRLRMARTLEATWPDIVDVNWRYGRAAHIVDWNRFTHPLVRKEDVDFNALPKVDEYGLTLKELKTVRSPNIQRVLDTYHERRGRDMSSYEYGTTLEAPTVEELEPEETPSEEPEPETPETVPEAVAAPHARCKVEGCPNPYAVLRGPYGRLCDVHASEAKEARSKPKSRQATAKRGSLGELVQNWLAARDDLEHAAAEIRDRTGSEPEEFIDELRAISLS